jgi:hypothetical protein
VSEESVSGRTRRAAHYYAVVAVGDVETRRGGIVHDVPDPIKLDSGWTFRIEGESESKPVELGSWTDQGLADFSGSAVYETTFELEGRYLNRPLILDLGKVRETAEILVNGEPVAAVYARDRRARSGGRESAGGRRHEHAREPVHGREAPERPPRPGADHPAGGSGAGIGAGCWVFGVGWGTSVGRERKGGESPHGLFEEGVPAPEWNRSGGCRART